MTPRTRTSMTLLVGFLLGVGVSCGVGALASQHAPIIPWRYANLFTEVYERIRSDYVDKIPDQKLFDGAVRGMMSGLDPYSTYLDAKEYEELRSSAAGSYSGVGIEVSTREGELRVVRAVEGAPAERAGIRADDVILAVDDIPVDPAHLSESVDRMRGKPGERVKLKIRRPDISDALIYQLIRRKVQVHSVKAQPLEPGYAVVRITQFSETTADDFAAALNQLQASSPLRGLILDLRDNPGGVLEAAAEIADDFLDNGVIVTADGRAVDSTFTLRAKSGDLLHGAPLVVLVNSGSASASEIVAGALQDHHRARLLGQVTYGKGVVQTLSPLQQGGAIKLTTSRYRTPSGAFIHERGITPDVTLSNTNASTAVGVTADAFATDAEVQAALADLKSHAAVEPTTMPTTQLNTHK